jgi:hypothetical protein
MQTIINVQSYNNLGLGDSIINFIFFKQIKEYIESNNIIIHYRCKVQHHKNLSDFNYSKNIIILPWENIGYILWQRTIFELNTETSSYEEILCLMFNIFLKTYNIPIVVNSFEYQDPDLFERFQLLDDQYKNVDILVINSIPLSGQFTYSKEEWNEFLIKLSKKYKIATTEKVADNILSINHFSVKNIAALATSVKKIITINTGPSMPLFNTDILEKVDQIYMFSDGYIFKTRKFVKMKHISELNFMLE